MESTRLLDLWTPYAGDDELARAEWSDLIERWSEPHRAYHNLEHLLLMLELLAAQNAHPHTMLAAWYHDAIYDPTSSTNEADSADLARESLTRLGKADATDRVANLVLLTAEHADPPDDEAALLLDADLAILGQSPAIYLRYVEAVRAEYSHVGDDDFRAGRSSVLRDLLEHERLFQHPAFRHLEDPARTNLTAELTVYDAAEPPGDD
ncbi:HD domain-containing protein [Cumulibacter soli]|uniref:HD domain-containing protein n=1 Tax=Cumulibacter soli TaxID=2546344 RepID=UPI0010683E61|nr:metal-dependent phosphohydrolase [Cumulibacter soli]